MADSPVRHDGRHGIDRTVTAAGHNDRQSLLDRRPGGANHLVPAGGQRNARLQAVRCEFFTQLTGLLVVVPAPGCAVDDDCDDAQRILLSGDAARRRRNVDIAVMQTASQALPKAIPASTSLR